MATPLTAGRAYFIESDSSNQDWILNNSGDPDAIDLDNYTGATEEGIGYIKFIIPEGFELVGFTGAIVTPSGAQKQFDKRNAASFYETMQRGMKMSLAEANLIDKFVMSLRHISGASAIFKRYYLIVYFGTNLHAEFTDENDVRQSYCKGIIQSVRRQWLETESLNWKVRINWDSVW